MSLELLPTVEDSVPFPLHVDRAIWLKNFVKAIGVFIVSYN